MQPITKRRLTAVAIASLFIGTIVGLSIYYWPKNTNDTSTTPANAGWAESFSVLNDPTPRRKTRPQRVRRRRQKKRRKAKIAKRNASTITTPPAKEPHTFESVVPGPSSAISADPTFGAMAPTTTTTPANASQVFEPLFPPPASDGYDWTISPFPNYALWDKSAPKYKVEAYVYPRNIYSTSMVLKWEDVPATIDAIYLVVDRERFKPEYPEVTIMYSSESNPQYFDGLFLGYANYVSNSANPIEAAMVVYDKHGGLYQGVQRIRDFYLEFPVDEAKGPDSLLSATSLFYVDVNGTANFLANATDFMHENPYDEDDDDDEDDD